MAQPCSVPVITPVIHYCMGGLESDDDSPVVGTDSQRQPTRGLYAAGEVAVKTISGKQVDHNVITGADFALQVRGNMRFGRTSLLDCVVIDRVTGVACNKYMLGGKEKRTSLALLSGGGLSGSVEGSKLAGGSYEDTMHTSFKASSGLTMDEVAKQTKKGEVWDLARAEATTA